MHLPFLAQIGLNGGISVIAIFMTALVLLGPPCVIVVITGVALFLSRHPTLMRVGLWFNGVCAAVEMLVLIALCGYSGSWAILVIAPVNAPGMSLLVMTPTIVFLIELLAFWLYPPRSRKVLPFASLAEPGDAVTVGSASDARRRTESAASAPRPPAASPLR